MLTSFAVSAQNDFSMRRCTLLPIIDNLEGALSFSVFEAVEDELQKNNWCTYISNSSLIDVFKKYNHNLEIYLANPEVLRTVSSKLKTGTNIKISLKTEIKGIQLNVKIIGSNGDDLYFEEKALFSEPQTGIIANKIISWLDDYSKKLPYHGRVTGILGEQVTIDIPFKIGAAVGQKFLIKRKVSKKVHPLLKRVVDWETKFLGEGKIFSVSKDQVIGIVQTYHSPDKVQKGDWIQLEAIPPSNFTEGYSDEEGEKYKFGKLGEASASLDIASMTMSAEGSNGQSNKLKGLIFGINLNSEVWITREYFVLGELGIHLGNVNKKSGNPTQDSVTMGNTKIKVAAGYKFLPMGFFYGPQLNAYAGLASYRFGVDKSASDGHGSLTFSGLMLGGSGSLPIAKDLRLLAAFEFIPFVKANDVDNVFGSEKDASSYRFNFGARYKHNHWFDLEARYELNVNSAKFKGAQSSLVYRENLVRLSGVMTF